MAFVFTVNLNKTFKQYGKHNIISVFQWTRWMMHIILCQNTPAIAESKKLVSIISMFLDSATKGIPL